MSRRNNTKANNGADNNGLPPLSHPAEHLPEHRAFLSRSLDRNDTDLAALIMLNKSLHAAKSRIMDDLGEEVLLDLGAGVIVLNANKDGLMEPITRNYPPHKSAKNKSKPKDDETRTTLASLDTTAQAMCLDFLQRMCLRRRLLNRLFRRLNRIAHAMDGEDVAPPPPPKYGDLRLDIDDATLTAFIAFANQREQAQRQLEMLRQEKGWAALAMPARHVVALEKGMAAPHSSSSTEDFFKSEAVADATSQLVVGAVSPAGAVDAVMDDDVKMESSNTNEPMVVSANVNVQPDGALDDNETTPVAVKAEEETKNDDIAVTFGAEPLQEGDTKAAQSSSVAAATAAPQKEEETADAIMADENEKDVVPSSTTAPDEGMDPGMPATGGTEETIASKTLSGNAVLPDTFASMDVLLPDAAPAAAAAETVAPAAEPMLLAEVTSNAPQPGAPEEKHENVPLAAAAAAAGPITSAEFDDSPAVTKPEPSATASAEDAPAAELLRAPRATLVSQFEGVDWRLFQEYHEPYEKRLDPKTGEPHYTLLDKHPVKDYELMKHSCGIGATNRALTIKEKEAEYQRWQAAVLAKIPDQPTFAELGTEHYVYHLEERRKRAREKAKAADAAAAAAVSSPIKTQKANTEVGSGKKLLRKSTPEKKDDDSDNSDDDNDDDDASMKDAEKDDDDKSAKGKKSDDDEEDEDEEDDDDGDKKDSVKGEEDNDDDDEEEPAATAPKIIKPISLTAVPSFHDQDSKRVKLLHAELMASSIHNHARRRLEEVTMDYNSALRMSNQVYERRSKVTSRMQAFVFEQRNQLQKVQNDYQIELAKVKAQWKKRKSEFDKNRLEKMFPTRWGRDPQGTDMTQIYMGRGGLHYDVAQAVADIVDSIDLVDQGRIRYEKFEDFQPPPPPQMLDRVVDQSTGETLGQRNQRMEQTLRKEVASLTMKLRQSEEERQKSWKKMLKTKIEYDVPHHSVNGRVRLPPDAHNTMPMPRLGQNTAHLIPHEVVGQRATAPSFAPAKDRYAAFVDEASTQAAPVEDTDRDE